MEFFIISNFTKEYKAAGGPGINGQIAVIICIIYLLIVGFIGSKKDNK